jgi:two-component system, chemotaxis family, sensor kinase Cph1
MKREIASGNRDLRFYTYVLAAIWAVFVFGTMLWGVSRVNETTGLLADKVLKAHFDKDQAFRLWATSHGGVYVPTNARTPPNPYLEQVPERDVRTPSGKVLTLMNPAYMLRQLHEDFAELYGIKGHITSLKPLRPENGPDDWEEKALESFKAGTTQVSAYAEIQGKPYLRLIRPVRAAKDCLKCHANIREGDVRGGVGVALPMQDFLEARRSEIRTLLVSHGSIFAIGLLGIVLGTRRLTQRERERDQAQEALRASEEQYRSLFDHSRDGVFITSREGVLVEANESLVSMFGYTSEEMSGMDIRQLYPDPSQRDKFREAIEHTGSVKGYESRYHRKDGSLIHCVVTANVRLGNDGAVVGYQGIVRDVTDKRRAEEALKNQSRELEAKNAELERFAYSISHDLKSPLITIRTFLGFIEEAVAKGKTQDVKPDLDRIDAAADKMGQLLEEILELSRVGRIFNPPSEVHPEDLVNEALELLFGTIVQYKLDVQIAPDLPVLYVDRHRLLEVFQNLIENSVKYMGDQAHPRIEVGSRKDGEETVLFVRDNGIGIDPAYHERIFELFSKLDPRTDGTGIGLALVKRIIEVHGGRIWVESDGAGHGSTFCFTLPCAIHSADLCASTRAPNH